MSEQIDAEVVYDHEGDCVMVYFWQDDELKDQLVLPKNITIGDLKDIIDGAIKTGVYYAHSGGGGW